MVPYNAETVWLVPPGQDAIAEEDRRAYEVQVPTYYSSVELRAQIARDHGTRPSEVELLRELASGLEALESDEGKRAEDRKILSAAVINEGAGGVSALAARARLAELKDRALRHWPPYRMLKARVEVARDFHVLAAVRRYVVGFRNLYDPATLEAEEPVALVAERLDDRLTEESLERIPQGDLIWLGARVQELEAPRGATLIKKSARPSSSPSTATPSTTAKNGHRKTRPRTAKGGNSRTSSKATGGRSA